MVEESYCKLMQSNFLSNWKAKVFFVREDNIQLKNTAIGHVLLPTGQALLGSSENA